MIRTILLTALVLAIAVGGGSASVWLMMDGNRGLGAIDVGNWTAFPNVGTRHADTYSQARFAREGGLSLGQAEGIAFIAQRDSEGRLLRRECAYLIEGSIPSTRFWTLYVADGQRAVLPPVRRRPPAMHSQEMLRSVEGSIHIAVGRHPAPGNWIGIGGSGPMQFVLSLYDTPSATSARVTEVELPGITRSECDD